METFCNFVIQKGKKEPFNLMTNSSDSILCQHDVLEFTQVAVQYCALLEQSEGQSRKDLCATLLKLTPLLYLKAQLLPRIEGDGTFLPDEQVTEQDYEYVRGSLASVLGNEDEYLDVVYGEMLQTDETQWKRISEHLADVYQPVRNFLATCQGGLEDCIQDALWQLVDSFELYWGQSLVDAMARLHHIAYAIKVDENDEDTKE